VFGKHTELDYHRPPVTDCAQMLTNSSRQSTHLVTEEKASAETAAGDAMKANNGTIKAEAIQLTAEVIMVMAPFSIYEEDGRRRDVPATFSLYLALDLQVVIFKY
jgi:hypothetical protein